MGKHKYMSLVKFVHLDGVKEFKDTDPTLFSKDGISTSSYEVDNGQPAIVEMKDAKRACELFLSGELNLFQLQQWGEWIHLCDFFEICNNEEELECENVLANVISDIDNLDTIDEENAEMEVRKILNSIEDCFKEKSS